MIKYGKFTGDLVNCPTATALSPQPARVYSASGAVHSLFNACAHEAPLMRSAYAMQHTYAVPEAAAETATAATAATAAAEEEEAPAAVAAAATERADGAAVRRAEAGSGVPLHLGHHCVSEGDPTARSSRSVPHPKGIIGRESAGGHGGLPLLRRPERDQV